MRSKAKVGGFDLLDVNIGSRMREVRTSVSMSLPTLAEQIGKVTWQQLQKYETGENRISASMMFRIACVLDVHPATFFLNAFDSNHGDEDAVDDVTHPQKNQ